MTVRFLLVRHASHAEIGKVLSGRGSDAPLSAKGRDEATRLADDLAIHDVGSIHASPQVRTQETAEILSDRLDVAVKTVAALDEIDFGTWTGQNFDALAADPGWQQWNNSRSSAISPGGESMPQATGRIVHHLEQVAGEAPARPVICVTHCDMIRGAIAYYLGLALDRLLRFAIDPASTSIIDIGPWGGHVVGVNRVCS
jgi:broad specificity phosphatase PhoE